MKSNTKEIFYAWQDFLNEGKQKSNLLSESFSNNLKQDRISEIRSLIEWGDNLEHLINENVEIRLLESHYLNEGVFSAFKKAKDKVKSFFTQGWTKDKVDDDGNIVRSDLNDEESAAVQEYTSKTKAVIGVLLAVKLTGIILGSLALGIGNTSNVDPSSINNKPAIVSVASDAVENTTGMDNVTSQDVETAAQIPSPQIQKFVFDEPIKITGKPPIQKLNFKPMIISVKKAVAKKVAEETGESESDVIERIDNSPEIESAIESDEFLAQALEKQALAHGIDIDDPRGFEYRTFKSSEVMDLVLANKYIKGLIGSTSFDGMKSTDSEIKSAIQSFDNQKLNDRMKELGREGASKLISAARIYTIKKLVELKPGIFEDAAKLKSTITGYEGGGNSPGAKNVDGDDHYAEGTSSAKVLVALYGSLNKFDQNHLDNMNVNQLESELKDSISFYGLNPNQGLGEKVVSDFMTFIIANAQGASSAAELKANLDSNSSFAEDVDERVQVLTTFAIDSSMESILKEK